ncbi:LysR family transcriptional regulator [Mycobacterium sp. NPDC003323]
MTLDLRRLGHFVAVAEAGSFTAAAATLHITQQALSQSVQLLEKDLGAQLFMRSGRRITPTAAGAQLVIEGRVLLAAADTVANRVSRTADDRPEVFVVGHTPALSSAEVYARLEPAIDTFGHLSVSCRQMYPDDLLRETLEGTVHLGLRRGIAPTAELSSAIIGYDRVRVAVHCEHRLADATTIDIHELSGEQIALWSPPGASYYSDFLMGACRRAGFEPDFVVSRVQGSATVAAPLTTGAPAFVTTQAGPAMDGRVRVIDLEPELLVGVQALWQRHTQSAFRDAILSVG